MIKSLEDVFASKDAIVNDPLKEIHNPCVAVESKPEDYEYDDMIKHIDPNAYPIPNARYIHNTVNPLNGVLKPIIINK